jgi:ADP-ribose pyrophosphatase
MSSIAYSYQLQPYIFTYTSFLQGPNQAADPIVTRSTNDNDVNNIEVVVIRRGDNRVWALPGGMVDANEESIDTAKREFQEEAGNHGDNSKEKQVFNKLISVLFDKYCVGRVYRGYVDEGRNTDNSWMESTAHHWHIPSSASDVYNIPLSSGDDATEVRWLNVQNDDDMRRLHGNHYEMIMKAVKQLKEKQKGRNANATDR